MSKKELFDHAKISSHYLITFVFFILILSLISTLGQHIIYNGDVWGTIVENHFESFNASWIITFIKSLMLNGIVCTLISAINILYRHKKIQTKNVSANKIFIFSLVIILIAWFPYYLSCMPGGVFADTFSSISQALNMDTEGLYALNNHHPILYTLFWRAVIVLCRSFNKDLFFTCCFFLTVQMIIMAISFAYTITWVYRKELSLSFTVILMLFVSLFPIFPMWAVSVWKDTFYGVALLLLSLHLGEPAFTQDKDLLNDNKYLIKLFILGIFTAFTRNNGKYILFAIILLFLIARLKRLKNSIKLLICYITLIFTIQIIQGPVYDNFNYNTDNTVESLAVPIQQMSYLVVGDYDLTEDELNYIGTIDPIDSIKQYYNPFIFDSLKWIDPNFNIDVIKNNPSRFFSVYFKLLLKHPIGCFKGMALETCGFWAPNIKLPTGGDILISVWNNDKSIASVDYFYQMSGMSLKNRIGTLLPIHGAVYVFCMFYCLYLLVANRDYKKIILLLPALLNWLTIIVATPIAGSFRYINITLLILPIEIMLVCLSSNKNRLFWEE